jgi:PucR C-terminal helix-turn-helix domain
MTQIAVDVPAEQWPCVMADVASAVGRRAAAVHEDVYRVILREIPQLRDDQPLLALLASSVGSNVDTCPQIMEHRMDLTAVAAPAAAVEYARRLAQRGTPLTALLRAYRVGHARPAHRPDLGRGGRGVHPGAGVPAIPSFSRTTNPARGPGLPLGIRDTFDAAAASTAGLADDLHFAFGDVAKGPPGFRLTHQQAVAARAVALATGPPPARVVAFSKVAPVSMMLSRTELLRAWVAATLGGLATDDEQHARLRETLLLFLHYKTTAERLVLHKNTVQYRIRRAEESLGRPMSENRNDVELALRATRWLGSSVLRPELGEPGSWSSQMFGGDVIGDGFAQSLDFGQHPGLPRTGWLRRCAGRCSGCS